MVAVTSAGASPGASALAVALGMARCRTGAGAAVLVEADPAGGRLGPRFGLANEPSLAGYVSDARRGGDLELLLRSTQPIGSLPVLVCPPDPELARQVIERGAGALALLLREAAVDSIVDLGRIDGSSPALPVAAQAHEVLLVTRPRFDEVQALLYRRRTLVDAGCTVALVTVGDAPFHPEEVADVAGLPLAATLPDDPAVASAFCGGRFDRKRLVRTRLWATVVGLADRLYRAQAA